ncbi:O-antigen polymerase [Halobacillus andaensis]|uniref:O-antigen polymerase n=1 Tax=Halobacillus andaensis TaxID=1176239 RepID=UPI003D7056A9
MFKKDINLSTLLKITILLIVISVTGLLTINSVIGGVIGFCVLTITAIFLVDFDVLHPYTWFSILFLLYSTSAPILMLIGETPESLYVHESLIVQWVAFSTFLIVLGPRQRKLSLSPGTLYGLKAISNFIFAFSIIISSISLLYIWMNGLGSKYDISLDNSIFSKLSFSYSFFILTYSIKLVYSIKLLEKLPYKLIVFSLSWGLLIIMISGDRDVFLRLLVVSFILINVLYINLSKLKLVILSSIMIFLVPLLHYIKNVGVSGSTKFTSNSNILIDVLSQEFDSASSNFMTLLENKNGWGFLWGETLWWDFKRVFLSSFPNITSTSPTVWFNNNFYPNIVEKGGGRGFSLVAEGYLNFGVFGSFLWFLLLGLFIRYLYKKAMNNILLLITYTLMIPIFMYTIRGDFSTLITFFLNHIGLPILIIYILKIFFERDKYIKNHQVLQ